MTLVVGIFYSSRKRLVHRKPILCGFLYPTSVPYTADRRPRVGLELNRSTQILVFTPKYWEVLPFIKLNVKVKVKLSLVLNWAPRHVDVRGSGGIAPCILNLGTRLNWMVSFTPRPLYLWGNNPSTHWIGGWVDPRAGSYFVAKIKIQLCWESNPGHLTCNLVTTYWLFFSLSFFISFFFPSFSVCLFV
jgi:hypothetical protein